MRPPAGRLRVGDRVVVPGGAKGVVARERLIATNGAWYYTVEIDGGGTREHPDYELRRVESAAPEE